VSKTDSDPLSPRTRILEAAEHLHRAQEQLAAEDDELAAVLDELARQVGEMEETLAATDDARREEGV
jgi:uncharacterized protein YukE